MGQYFINGNGHFQLTQEVRKMIREAKIYIKAGNFLFQYPEIISELKEAMQRNVVVFIISNLKRADKKPYQVNGVKDDSAKMDTHIVNLRALTKLGAHCHSLDDLHAKFIIADGTKALLMSANFALNSMNRNTETGIMLEKEELLELEYTFDKLYSNSDVTYVSEFKDRNHALRQFKPLDGDTFDHFVSQLRLTVASPSDDMSKSSTNLHRCQVYTLYDSILEVIDDAEEYVYMVTWHFKKLQKLPKFLETVQRAVDRGVLVCVYSNDKGPDDGLQASLDEINKLKKIGCKSYGDDNNHSKCVLNEKSGILFTANIDGANGLRSGFEVGCMFDKEQRDRAYEHILSLIGE